MRDFYQLTYRGRALRLRALALAALQEYGLNVKRVRVITIETNGIFRVDTVEGRKFVLRISDPSGCHDLDEICSEMVWLSALRCDTSLGLPEPLPARNGSLVTTVQVPGVPEARHCALFTWLPGPDLADRLNIENVYKQGQYSARLHEHAKTFSPPEDFRLRRLDRVFPYSDPDFAYVEPVLIFDDGFSDLFPTRRLEIFRLVVDRIQSALDDLYADPGELRVIHYDLHQWNVKVYRGKVYALDFEDLIWGYPIQDIATTLYYYQGYSNWKDLFEAFRQGYTSQSEWPEAYPGKMETFMAGRGIMLVNYLLCSPEAEDQEMAPEFIAREERRLLAFLEKD